MERKGISPGSKAPALVRIVERRSWSIRFRIMILDLGASPDPHVAKRMPIGETPLGAWLQHHLRAIFSPAASIESLLHGVTEYPAQVSGGHADRFKGSTPVTRAHGALP
jgi:hypothetical protein